MRIAIIQTSKSNKCWWEYGESGTLTRGYGVSNVTIIEDGREIFRELKTDLPYDPAPSLLGVYPKEKKSTYERVTCNSKGSAVQFTVGKMQNWPRCPSTDNWVKKPWYIHTTGYYTKTKEWNLTVCNKMSLTENHYA